MKKLDLGGTWTLTGGGYSCTGTIPGSVCSFLLDAGLLDDPFYRDNELKTEQLLENVFTFSRTFVFAQPGCPVKLRCEGLDTLCTIVLNGTDVASTQNMHRTYEFDVTELLRTGENTISLRFDPASPYIRAKDAERHIHGTTDPTQGFNYLRKAHCMFGWDWGPRIPDAGIWRSISLVIYDSARITDCRIVQRHAGGKVWLNPVVTTDKPCALTAQLTAPDGTAVSIACNTETEIANPQLWWPNGLGEQALYTLTVTASENGGAVDFVTKAIGLRTMELIRKGDRYGESFYHQVNGVPFFAMGADYIPEDCILSRITAERTEWLLKQCRDSHFNAIRIWGGGHYPADFFFDICDRMGIVVFFDMAVACCYLPDSQEMRDEIVAEVRDNLLRLRHHPSIAVLSGNNEVEQFAYDTPPERDLAENYFLLFEELLPAIVEELCPDLPYIPSSPTTCGHFINPYDENYGDSHYWMVWHGGLPYAAYREHYFRYLSEFGFQSFPSEKTINAITLPGDRNIFSRIMERHQRNGSANGKILGYLSQTFLYPNDFGTLLYASQLLQATAIQYGVEHLRRNRGRCMGTLYWQLNDNWPVASWASIDYYGRYKALQYAAKRFFAPVMISCEETGETTTRTDVNQPLDTHDYTTTAMLAVSNESRKAVSGTVRWQLCGADSTVLQEGSQDITVEAQSVVKLERIDFRKTNVEENHLMYWFEQDNQVISRGSVLFTAPKHYNFRDPSLRCEVSGDTITVFADAYAKYVEIDSPDSDFILCDNYFDMEAGIYTVKILEGTPKTIRLRSVYDIR